MIDFAKCWEYIEYGNSQLQSLKELATVDNVVKYIKGFEFWKYFEDEEIEVPVSPDEELLMAFIFFLFFAFALCATYITYTPSNWQLEQKETFFWIVMNRLKLGITNLSQMIYATHRESTSRHTLKEMASLSHTFSFQLDEFEYQMYIAENNIKDSNEAYNVWREERNRAVKNKVCGDRA